MHFARYEEAPRSVAEEDHRQGAGHGQVTALVRRESQARGAIGSWISGARSGGFEVFRENAQPSTGGSDSESRPKVW